MAKAKTAKKAENKLVNSNLVLGAEQTPAQTITISYASSLENTLSKGLPSGVTYATYREMRKDPTIALSRSVLCVTVLAGKWTVEAEKGVSDEVIEAVNKAYLPQRELILESAIYGGIDFGWAPFEQVFKVIGGFIVPSKIKPLLQDITEIVVTEDTGAFAGYKQTHRVTGTVIKLPVENTLHIPFRVEGTQWNGQSLLENVRSIYTKWNTADAGAAAYDQKIAGSHYVVYFPAGVSMIDGTETDNGTVAASVLTALESSGSITIPSSISKVINELNGQASSAYEWKVEILEDAGGRQPTFVDRLKYLDALKVRAMLLPERSILEGEFGTKAEAGIHADIGLKSAQLTDAYITRLVNWHSVDRFLAYNFGEEYRGKVRLKAAPLVNEQIAFLRMVYMAILQNPQGYLEESGGIDTDALKDAVGVPKTDTVAQSGDNEDDTDTDAAENGNTLPLPGLTKAELDKAAEMMEGEKE